MSLRRLLPLSAAVSGRLRRSLSTGVSSLPPSWVLFEQATPAVGSGLRSCARIVEPPDFSQLAVPALHVNTSDVPDPDSDVTQLLGGQVCSASGDGLVLVTIYDMRFPAPILAKQGAHHVRQMITEIVPEHNPDITRFLCNPLTGQLTRLPDIGSGPKQIACGPHMGVLTQADRGHGPPDRFAVAELQGNTMLRFLSNTGGWELAGTAPCRLPRARGRVFFERGGFDQEAVAFAGRLWWVDLTWGAISADPFSDRPEPRFVELPRGSVLPARSTAPTGKLLRTFEEGEAYRRCALGRYRRMGVSEGRLRYVEVWDREPFVLTVFALDDQGSAWTLEHRLVLSRLWADGDHPWLPLPEKTTPQISALHPLDGNVIYLSVGEHVIVVDMNREEVIGSSPRNGTGTCVTCVLPPWLESSRIPAGNH
ncbi:uncharacterized protein LOC124648710 [Lolium rigidum]|uniref:uncharacterized protein LOC124648710 n=1 Tax=Lolium rigidum TaxID=89674 RepID=UPI001F5CE403|nr:uncharacterized protein LOC124648710 [Lolium rigidum]